MTAAQRRLLRTIQTYGDGAEFWPVVNDWVKGDAKQRSFPLALRNINRTVDALLRVGAITITDEGHFQLTDYGKAVA